MWGPGGGGGNYNVQNYNVHKRTDNCSIKLVTRMKMLYVDVLSRTVATRYMLLLDISDVTSATEELID